MCKGIKFKVIDGGYPNSDNVMRNGILLPVHHGLTEEMFDRFYFSIEKFINKFE